LRNLSRALEINPDFTDAEVAMGNALLEKNQSAEAWQKSKKVLAQLPGHEGALFLKARCLFAENKWSEVEPVLLKLIHLDPQNAEYYLMLARSRENRRDIEGAIEILHDLLKKKRNKQALLMLAGIYENNNELLLSEKVYKSLVSCNPGNEKFIKLLLDFYKRNRENRKAENFQKQLVADYPEKEEYRLSLAEFFLKTNQNESMVEVLKNTIEDIPKKYKAFEMLANYYRTNNAPDKALKVLDRFIETVQEGPQFLRAIRLKAVILSEQKKNVQALGFLNTVVRENPGDLIAHTLKGDILINNMDYLGAITEYRLVLFEEQNNIAVIKKLAGAHLLNNEPLLSERLYIKVLNLDPEDREARMALSEIYKQKKKGSNNEIMNYKLSDNNAILKFGMEPEG
jgi:predicted Zn-dependent protease